MTVAIAKSNGHQNDSSHWRQNAIRDGYCRLNGYWHFAVTVIWMAAVILMATVATFVFMATVILVMATVRRDEWCHASNHCNTLQRTATRCNTLQHAATRCNTLQHAATRCNTFNTYDSSNGCCQTWWIMSWIKSLQHTATHCNTLQHTATHSITYGSNNGYSQTWWMQSWIASLQHTATRCNKFNPWITSPRAKRNGCITFPSTWRMHHVSSSKASW